MSLPPLRAPQDDGETLIYPPLESLSAAVDRNRQTLHSSKPIFGRPLADFRRQARDEAVAAAREYLASSGEPLPSTGFDSLVLAGHQPDVFHPGVWLKNFALGAFARRFGAAPLNLVVDNDTIKRTAIAVPQLADRPELVHRATVHYDAYVGEEPYEERRIRDADQFVQFPHAVAEIAQNWPSQPILAPFWREVEKVRVRTNLIGELFVGARRIFERRWGLHNLELPLSRLSATPVFAEFALGVLASLPAVHDAYKSAVHEYRARRGIKSGQHPVPDLARDGDWWEAPFWAWKAGQSRRARLFVRAATGVFSLRAGDERWPDVKAGNVAGWLQLERDGFKIRTRALTTTFFARLLLADLFIHGIGGGQYDELTDELFRRLFHLEPPAFAIVTGTLKLPLPLFAGTVEELRAARRFVRDLQWNPQRHVVAPEVQATLADLISQTPTDPDERRARFHRIRELKATLEPQVADTRIRIVERSEVLANEVAANALLGRRDYSFVLHPDERLRAFLTGPWQ